jgi:hypothetical protein
MINGVMTSIIPKPLYGEPHKKQEAGGEGKTETSKAL